VLNDQGRKVEPDREIIAVIAYLKKLGTYGETGLPLPATPAGPEAPAFQPTLPDAHRRNVSANP
jgi:hypothetical protein